MTRWTIPAACALFLTIGCGTKLPEERTAGPVPPPASPTAKPQEPAAPEGSYEAEIQKFQQQREGVLKTDTGWLTIAGLFFLSQPSTTFGSDPLNDIVLPAAAPAHAGTFTMNAGKVHVQSAPGVSFKLGDKTIESADLTSDIAGPPDRIGLGDLQLWVHMSGNRQSIRLRDPHSRLRTEFTGTTWFPIDKAYRVDAEYTPYPQPKMLQIANVLGDIDTVKVPGIVSFTLNGQAMKMEPVVESDANEFWFIFRDLTSGKESYAAARFLYLPGPVNGRMTIDFNRAENPPCAYNPYTTCPLPPEQNRLRARVAAGEMAYAGHP